MPFYTPSAASTDEPRPRLGQRFAKLAVLAGKSVKLGKVAMFLLTGASYAWFYTWGFAFVLVTCILIHEYGHTVAMRRVGIAPRGIWMVPFMGGMAFTEPPKTLAQEGFIALGGPLFGLGTVLALLALWPLTGNVLWAQYASMIALVNLFNLLPLGVLDGGRAMRAITVSLHSGFGWVVWGLSIVAGVVLAVWMNWWILVLVMGLSLLERFGERKLVKARMTPTQVGLTALAYAALIAAFLGLIVGLSHVPGADLPHHVLRG